MRIFYYVSLVAILIFFLLSRVFAQSLVRDDIGQIIQIHQPAKRVISLAPNLTEILFAIGAGNTIVGISSGDNYPAAVRHIPIIANYSYINVEAILALHPDLIVAWQDGNSMSELSRLQQLGFPIYFAKFAEIKDITHTMSNLALLMGTQKSAAPIIAQIRQGFSSLQKKYAGRFSVPVFYQIWQYPLFTINRHSFINQVIHLCGGRNIFADAQGNVLQVNQEAVLAAGPLAIITSESDPNWQQPWLKWQELAAVHYKNLYRISPELIERPGPRLLQGAVLMCNDLQVARISTDPNKKTSLIRLDLNNK
jgi:iron complex transport system substrate-binding protein